MSQDYIEKVKRTFNNAELIPEIIKLIEEGHTVTLQMRGFSMRPFLENNRDRVLLTKPTYLNVGDAVLAEILPGKFVIHRIVHIHKDDITLRGDGNILSEHCTRKDIKGFALGFYRKGKNKIDKTNSLKWRLYSTIWCSLLPIRKYLLAIYRRLWIPVLGPM